MPCEPADLRGSARSVLMTNGAVLSLCPIRIRDQFHFHLEAENASVCSYNNCLQSHLYSGVRFN